jgi:hypothetical protein
MSTRWFFAAVAAFLTLVSTSCSQSGPGFYPVHGKVTYKGQPAKGAAVHFHREGETAEEATNFPIGMVDEEGNFSLEVHGVGTGALPGKYKVLVRWNPQKDPDAPTPTPATGAAGKKTAKRQQPTESVAEQRRDPKSDKDRFNFRYFQLAKPLLFAEVKPETNNLTPFDLEDGPPAAEEKKPRRATAVTEDRG